MSTVKPLIGHLDTARFDDPVILKKLTLASRKLAELKGAALSIPRPGILINTLAMQEAKDSSAIENIVTTHDEVYREEGGAEDGSSPAAKEVVRYREALRLGLDLIDREGLLTVRHILAVQEVIERNNAGFRRLPGTVLKDTLGNVVYTPPQSHDEIAGLMGDLEKVINDPDALRLDPLLKMVVVHHQFESIHPFYDGNGRTGRILNILYMVKEGLLDLPVLYFSRHIVRTKSEYYRLLQAVRDNDAWEEWALYLLEGVERTASEAIETIGDLHAAFMDYKHRMRSEFKFYSQDLLNNLFTHPYTKIDFVQRELKVSRNTASRYLEALADGGLLDKRRVGRSNYYVNRALYAILAGERMGGDVGRPG